MDIPTGILVIVAAIVFAWIAAYRKAGRIAERERWFIRDLERAEKRTEERKTQHPAAYALAEFVRGSNDLDLAIERAQSISAVPLNERSSGCDYIIGSLVGITRLVGLSRDCLRQGDADKLDVFLQEAPTSSLSGLRGSGGQKILKVLNEVETSEGGIVAPLRSMTSMQSEESSELYDLLLAFGKEVSCNPPEAASRRALGVDWLVSLLDTVFTGTGAAHGYPTQDADEPSGYELFNLTSACSDAQLRAAYLEKLKSWHPDVLNGVPDELKAVATAKVQLYNDTYASLKASRVQAF